jgi:hypothetical protein
VLQGTRTVDRGGKCGQRGCAGDGRLRETRAQPSLFIIIRSCADGGHSRSAATFTANSTT